MTPHALLEPVSVGLQFGFLAVLYLFLLWVSRSALRDLRRSSGPRSSAAGPVVAPGPDGTSIYAATNHGANGDGEPRLIVERAPGHTPGMEYDIGEGADMGRGDQAEIRPSGGDNWTITDLGSTNGVKVNGRAIGSVTPIRSGDEIVVGTVDVRFEVER